MILSFNDCISTKTNSFFSFSEKFLYLDGLSNKLGYQKFQVYKEKNLVSLKNNEKPLNWKQITLTITKLFFITLLPFVAVIALIGKAIHRHTHPYQILKNRDLAKPIPKNVIDPIAKKISKPKTAPSIPSFKEFENVPKIPDIIPLNCDIRDEEWLSNKQINNYFVHLKSKNPQIYIPWESTNQLKDIESNILTKVPDKIYDTDFFPYSLNVPWKHWTLVFVDRQKRTIEFYDSKKDYGNHHEIKKRLKKLAHDLSLKDPGAQPYKFSAKIKKSLQPDSYQCGIWILYFLTERLKNPDVDFNQLDFENAQTMIKNFRIHVMAQLIEDYNTVKRNYEKSKKAVINPA